MSSAAPGPVESLLSRAWERIRDPEKRCDHAAALNADDEDVHPYSEFAVRWCTGGALDAERPPKDIWDDASALLDDAALGLGYGSYIDANDDDVLNNPPKIYARAIESARSRGI